MKSITPGFSILCETELQETNNVLCIRDYKKTDSVEMGGETKQEV